MANDIPFDITCKYKRPRISLIYRFFCCSFNNFRAIRVHKNITWSKSSNPLNRLNQIFNGATILYGQFTILKYTLLRMKEQPHSLISPDAVVISISQCEQIIATLRNIDYRPIQKSNELAKNLKEMENLIAKKIASILFNAKFMQQAVIQDRISEIEQTGRSINPTYNSYYCKQTIDKLLEDIIPVADDLTSCVRKIAKVVNRQDKFEQIDKDFTCFEDNYEAPSLEKYLGL